MIIKADKNNIFPHKFYLETIIPRKTTLSEKETGECYTTWNFLAHIRKNACFYNIY